MNKNELALDTARRQRPRRSTRWMPLVLASLLAFGGGIGQGVAVADTDAGIQRLPVPSKAANRAGLKAAAERAVQSSTGLQVAPTSLQGTPVTSAFPTSPVDEKAVPHYFGPFSNWALSPLTWPDATVEIVGNGRGATATATVGANGAITGLTLTNPGTGYTSATVNITGSGTGAAATATVTTTGVVTGVTVNSGGAGYTAPVVTFTGGGTVSQTVQVGNPRVQRYAASHAAINAGELLGAVLPTGQLTGFETYRQSTGVNAPSAGKKFHAYVLRPTGTPNEYSVVYDSGLLTVPAGADGVVSYSANAPVEAGDRLMISGQGIPWDWSSNPSLLPDQLIYPEAATPVQGTTITIPSATYPIYSPPQSREISFAATVVTPSYPNPTAQATGTVYGGVDAVAWTDTTSSWLNPTVDVDMPDGPDGVKAILALQTVPYTDPVLGDRFQITGITVVSPGSGYSFAPNVVVRDGTLYEPTNVAFAGPTTDTTSTLYVQTVALDTFGAGYYAAPDVAITDAAGTGTGATATASVSAGGVTALALTSGGSGYVTPGGMKKFVDDLPMLCNPVGGGCTAAATANNLGKYIPLAVPDTTTFPGSDYYVIGLVQQRECMSSSVGCTAASGGTLLRKYVQLSTPALETERGTGITGVSQLRQDNLDGSSATIALPAGVTGAVTDPRYLGPIILAQKDRPVRVTFYNLLPTGSGGDLIIPSDSTLMGAGAGPGSTEWSNPPADEGTVMDGIRNPACSQSPKPADPAECFADNRATLHLHGGTTPWISDGTPHQWITPAGEVTDYPQGQSVGNVPDMGDATTTIAGVPNCSGETDGCQTFYWTNQQSARLLFYHDHAFGTTRLNVYLGEAAGYVITDPVEQTLFGPTGTFAELGEGLPLIVQDRTFVPDAAQLAELDPTWDYSRWGSYGDFWYHHVYMTAQNPGDPSGMSGYGRWMYGPWFWPPAVPPHGPINNPYYNKDPATGFTTDLAVPCSLDDPATWQYQTDPFCEPPLIPGTPNISVGMEQFNDTPLVNGVAYPTVTLEPKAYRFRVLNAANDRFMNLSLYEADPTTASTSTNAKGALIGGTEVALNPAELAAAQLDPVVFPTPDTTLSPPGPSWIVIANEGGFLPAPVVVPPQPTTWITDPTRFDVGNVDLHSLLVAPAERMDVIVDFSQYAGKTLILYNDAPAAFPARVPSYDYYTGQPDLYPVGAGHTLPGYGPNTRTVMQIKVAASTPAPAFNLRALQRAFTHKANGSGVFEKGQHPIIVGQAAYNSAYGTRFVASGDCNNPVVWTTDPPGDPNGVPVPPDTTNTLCDGLLRINNQGGTWFGFNTLLTGTAGKLNIPLQPKGIHDEMNSAAFDEFGRMTANIGLEVVPANPAAQNIVLYPYINPTTEMIDGTKLPKGLSVTPIKVADDGTQIWKITHNGVDTHPLHFHLYDVQLLNRVTWDNIIIPNDPTELGWKDTVRTSPLEDTIVALRPVVPAVPFDLPNSVRMLNPAMPEGATLGFNNIDAQGLGTAPITNQLVNFGWEYVWHCHILSHEEMDMMRPQSLVLPPNAPSGLAVSGTVTDTSSNITLTWTDNSLNETAFVPQESTDGTTWTDLGTVPSPLGVTNLSGVPVVFPYSTAGSVAGHSFRVVAQNTAGYGQEFASMTAQSVSNTVQIPPPPVAPTNVSIVRTAVRAATLSWTDASTNETSFQPQVSICTNPGTGNITCDQWGPWTNVGAAITRNPTQSAATGQVLTASVTWTSDTLANGSYARYQVLASNGTTSAASASVILNNTVAPVAPSNVAVTCASVNATQETCTVTWVDNANNNTQYAVQRSTSSNFNNPTSYTGLGANTVTFTTPTITKASYYFRVRATNSAGNSAYVTATPAPVPAP